MRRCRAWWVLLALSVPAWAADGEAEEVGEPGLLAEGIAEQARQARVGLVKGELTWAVRALDQAHEVAMVGAAAGDGGARLAFQGTLKRIREARRAVQNRRPARATELLEEVRRSMENVGVEVVLPEGDLARYRGARLVNARGELLGELQRIEGDQAVVVLGGARDVLGLVDLGGIRASVPTSMLVFGPRPLLGPARVVLLTGASRTELARRAILAPAS